MTIATQVKNNYSNFANALVHAEQIAVDAEQDWENQTTIFVFSDGSRLKAVYPEITVL